MPLSAPILHGSLTRSQTGTRCAQTNAGPQDHLRCRSSGVEHSLGKGEAESSNLSGSTIYFNDLAAIVSAHFWFRPPTGESGSNAIPVYSLGTTHEASIAIRY